MRALRLVGRVVALVTIRLVQIAILLLVALLFGFTRPEGWEHE